MANIVQTVRFGSGITFHFGSGIFEPKPHSITGSMASEIKHILYGLS